MNWIQKLARRLAARRAIPDDAGLILEREFRATRQKIGSSLVLAMEIRDSALGVTEHSAQVSLVCGLIADCVELSEAERYVLQTAAQLHELGMFAVPPGLLDRPTALTSEELEQVRAQARVSAEVARLVHPPRVAEIIERQYEDHYRVSAGEPFSDRDALLAGILRVADVFAAVTWPRPYQDPMPPQLRTALLEGGAGTQFHPVAVRTAVQLWPRPEAGSN